MTQHTAHPRSLASRVGRAALGPVLDRLDALQADLLAQRAEHERLKDTVATLAATVEQQAAATERLEAYLDVAVSELRDEAGQTRHLFTGMRSLLTYLGAPSEPDRAGDLLRERFEGTYRHADELAERLRGELVPQFGELRAGNRLTQSLIERALAMPAQAPPSSTSGTETAPDQASPSRPGVSDAGVPVVASAVTPTPAYDHPVPSFDLLYRAFEDRHRGTLEEITRRQRDDYLELLGDLPNPELPIADLGCGRGELVRLLDKQGIAAIGVDVNTGQVADDDQALLIEDDLFHWLDRQPDGSLRAVTSAHVVEHLPTDLQIRLVFEAFRVLAPGGALVLETPNALSLSTAATNFWVDPTHERPVHPLLLEFFAHEAGFADSTQIPLHPVALSFETTGAEPQLVDNLNSLIFGFGDLAFVARR